MLAGLSYCQLAQHVEQELMETRQTLQHYVALGERFTHLAAEHCEVVAEIEILIVDLH